MISFNMALMQHAVKISIISERARPSGWIFQARMVPHLPHFFSARLATIVASSMTLVVVCCVPSSLTGMMKCAYSIVNIIYHYLRVLGCATIFGAAKKAITFRKIIICDASTVTTTAIQTTLRRAYLWVASWCEYVAAWSSLVVLFIWFTSRPTGTYLLRPHHPSEKPPIQRTLRIALQFSRRIRKIRDTKAMHHCFAWTIKWHHEPLHMLRCR